MTYSPGNPGYPAAQPPGGYGPVSSPSFTKSTDTASKLPLYLQVAVVALGFATYLVSFGPMLTATSTGPGRMGGHAGPVVALAVLAALLAAVGLLPKAKNYTPVVAVVAVLGVLLAITRIVHRGDNYTIGWALWLVLALVVVQSLAAVGILLLEAGVVTAPAPRPRYDPYAQYGLPPGGGYYSQPGQPTGPQSRSHYQPPQQSGYSPYGGYPAGPGSGGVISPSGPSTGGFGTGPQHAEPQGPPTPPTGFPSFGSPSNGSAAGGGGQGHGSANSSQAQQQPSGGQGSQSSSPAPSGPTPS